MIAYGEMFQVGYVVPDLDAALAHWTERMKVGPFFLYPMPIPFRSVAFRGNRIDPPDVIRRVAVGYAGDMMIELIEPGSAPSTYREFLGAGLQGVHHLGAMADDLDATRDRMIADGATVIMEGKLAVGEFCYLEFGGDPPGTLYELMNGSDDRRALFGSMKAAAQGWDGKDPVRQLGSLKP